jgi:hypothetical protein
MTFFSITTISMVWLGKIVKGSSKLAELTAQASARAKD